MINTKLKTIGVVYKIINIIDNKLYIGSTVNYKKRCKAHIKLLNNNKHYNFLLQNAFEKYGINNFKFEIIEEIKKMHLLRKREMYYINLLCSYGDNGYNLILSGRPPICNILNEFEQKVIKEKQMEGIRIRKEQGLYTGRKKGTIIAPKKFLKYKKSQLILNYLSKGCYSYEEISKLVPCSKTTIVKVKKINSNLEIAI